MAAAECVDDTSRLYRYGFKRGNCGGVGPANMKQHRKPLLYGQMQRGFKKLLLPAGIGFFVVKV